MPRSRSPRRGPRRAGPGVRASEGIMAFVRAPSGTQQDLLAATSPEEPQVPARSGAKKAGASRWLPFSKQFSPGQIDSLHDFLRIVDQHGGGRDDIVQAVLKRYRPEANPTDKHKQTMAYNAILSAQHYGLVNHCYELTTFGRELEEAPDEQALLAKLARHILQRLNGIELVRGLIGIEKADLRLRKDQIASHFIGQGLWSNPDGTDINHVVAWLRAAGVFQGETGFVVDTSQFERLAEVSLESVAKVGGVDLVGSNILQELALFPGRTATTGDIQRRLKARPGLDLNIPGFVSAHLRPLERAGLITIEKVTGGRGGEAMRITATPLFGTEVAQGLLRRAQASGLTVSDPELQSPMSDLVSQMSSSDKNVKGRALELFALRLLLRLGLSELEWRPRPDQAEEIDGSAVGYYPIHIRWQVQCKNTGTLHVDDAAKEVGLAVRNRSTVIMLVTTGNFSRPAQDFISEIVRHSPYTILCLNHKDVERLAADEASLSEILRREADRAHQLRATAVVT